MRVMLSLVVLTGLAVVSRGSPEKLRFAKLAVPVLNAAAVDANALKQVTTASPKLGHEVPTAASSLETGLLHVQKTYDRPILAMAESGGWFFYATSVARESNTEKPVFMISGYAIKRDGRRVIRWSVW
jgi:hypothetical protein